MVVFATRRRTRSLAMLLGVALLAAVPSITGPASAEAGTDRDARASARESASEWAVGRAIEWAWPLGDGRPMVVRGFEPPAEPWLAGHRGVDLLGAPGSVVRTAAHGVVTYAGPVAGVGVVVVAHGEIRTTYQPVRASVRVGDAVGARAEIGALEPAGSHCAPAACLHWGALRANTYLDPLALVGGGGRVRLAPLGPHALGPAAGADAWAARAAAPAAGAGTPAAGAGAPASSVSRMPANGSVSQAAGSGALSGFRSS